MKTKENKRKFKDPRTEDQKMLDMFRKNHAKVEEIVSKKFNDYGKEPLLKFTDLGCFIKLITKLQRVEGYYRGKSYMVDESVEDTFLDIAAFAIWAVTVRKYVKENNLKKYVITEVQP
jgi:hypothetical protein